MAAKCVPMFHVPDVRATVEWHRGIGFGMQGEMAMRFAPRKTPL